MSFIIRNNVSGKVYAPGYFLAHEECTRKTREISQSHSQVVTADGKKHVPAGAFYPANNSSTVEGIVYEDVDVTSGNMPGSVVLKGEVYLDRLPAAPESGVQSALEGKGFVFITSAPGAIRPKFPATLETLTVTSAASATADGKTAVSFTGYTVGTGETRKYKIADTTAPSVKAGEILDSTWTTWNGTDEISSTDGKKITVAIVNDFGEAIAAGNATVDVK